MVELNLTKIGNSYGIILSKDILSKLRVGEKGEKLYLSELPDGFKLSAYDEELISQIEAAEVIMREDKEVLKALAKR